MNPAEEAKKLLDELGIDSLPVIPQKICETLGIRYLEEPLSIDGYLLILPSGLGHISINSLIGENERKNFTGAHELGHYCMDGMKKNAFYCSQDVITSGKRKLPPEELRANEFAAELLMPESIYTGLVNSREPGWDSIQDLAGLSQTSLWATARRFIELTDYPCALVITQAGKVIFNKSKYFELFISTEGLSSRTTAYKAFRGETPPDRFESISANSWVTGQGLEDHLEILEWSLPMNSYGQVFTLLYDEECIGSNDCDEEPVTSYSTEYAGWDPPLFHKSKRKR